MSNADNNGIVNLGDITGRIVLTQKVYSGVNTMDVSSVANGSYILLVKNGEKNELGRVIVRRD